MANKRKGEVEIQDSDGKAYILKFGTSAICKIEDALNKNLGEILSELGGEKLRMSTIRTMVQMSLKDSDLTPDQVGDLIDDVGFQKITEAFSLVFGEEKKEDSPLDAGELTGVSAS